MYLVSASFLSSDYCWKKEFESILAKHKEGNCLIIPIIVRACDWKTSPLGKIQGLPEDGKAISSWDDIDSAWENVVHGVRIAIDEFKKKSEERVVNNSVLSKSFSDFLDDTTIPFYNKGNNMVSFSDIYVLPDLIKLDSDLERKKIHISDIYKSGKFIIYGDEKSGKSSLLK